MNVSTSPRSAALSASLALGLVLTACGGTPTPRPVAPRAEAITDASYAAEARRFHGMRYDDRDRRALRDRLLAYLDTRGRSLLEGDDFDAILSHFAEMTDLLIPADFAEGRLPETLGPTALRLVELGSPRGDEGAVLAGLRVLSILAIQYRERDPGEEYSMLARWSVEARAELPNLLQRYTQLISVWEDHARLTPDPEVLAQLAELHVARRDAVLRAFQSGGGELMQYGAGLPQQVSRIAPLDVAGVYLREGDVASAITHVRAMGVGAGDSENRLLHVLQIIHAGGPDGADAIITIADAFGEARPETALGLCRLGHRDYPSDARFPGCLARLGAARGQFHAATAWYRVAIGIAPEERSLYDEALAQLNRFIARGIFDEDPTAGRALVRDAQQILRERERRWPGAEAPVTPEQLEFLFAMLEMHAGNVDDARTHFEASLAVTPSFAALHELGLLEHRLGRRDAALTQLRAALDRVPQTNRGAIFTRAQVLGELGDAYRVGGDAQRAQNMYNEALSLWNQGGEGINGEQLAHVHARRGVLLDRLGRRAESVAAFRLALRTAPRYRESHAMILSHLVTAQEPDVALANEVFHRALLQLGLEDEWKVYFALWVQVIAARGEGDAIDEVEAILTRFASHSGWSSQLARFGAEQIDAAALLSAAETPGQRAEAAFYTGALMLATGDRPGAERSFTTVFESNMVAYYEFTMARELSATMAAPAAE